MTAPSAGAGLSPGPIARAVGVGAGPTFQPISDARGPDPVSTPSAVVDHGTTERGIHTPVPDVSRGLVGPITGATSATPSLFWENLSTGQRFIWLMDGTNVQQGASLSWVPTRWTMDASADLSGDGKPDLVWTNQSTGLRYVWYMDGTADIGGESLGSVPVDWSINAAADFNGDEKADLVWTNESTGQRYIWYLDGTTNTGGADLGIVPTHWRIVGAGDFNGDRKPDLVWTNENTGERYVWFMDGASNAGGVSLGTVAPHWEIVGTTDLTRDGHADLLWQNTNTGLRYVWFMRRTTNTGGVELGTNSPEWSIGAVSSTPTTEPVASVEVIPASASLEARERVQLTARTMDAAGNELQRRQVGWATSDPSVAMVTPGGEVTGMASGRATITATSEGRTGTATITVTSDCLRPVLGVGEALLVDPESSRSCVDLGQSPGDYSLVFLDGRVVQRERDGGRLAWYDPDSLQVTVRTPDDAASSAGAVAFVQPEAAAPRATDVLQEGLGADSDSDLYAVFRREDPLELGEVFTFSREYVVAAVRGRIVVGVPTELEAPSPAWIDLFEAAADSVQSTADPVWDAMGFGKAVSIPGTGQLLILARDDISLGAAAPFICQPEGNSGLVSWAHGFTSEAWSTGPDAWSIFYTVLLHEMGHLLHLSRQCAADATRSGTHTWAVEGMANLMEAEVLRAHLDVPPRSNVPWRSGATNEYLMEALVSEAWGPGRFVAGYSQSAGFLRYVANRLVRSGVLPQERAVLAVGDAVQRGFFERDPASKYSLAELLEQIEPGLTPERALLHWVASDVLDDRLPFPDFQNPTFYDVSTFTHREYGWRPDAQIRTSGEVGLTKLPGSVGWVHLREVRGYWLIESPTPHFEWMLVRER
ncbi:MAG: FG-GAP-like repeat-containing protein [Longimicrobiales bacterium]